ncbi:Stig1 domain-containing protein, partial [Cephalotus follicularis]
NMKPILFVFVLAMIMASTISATQLYEFFENDNGENTDLAVAQKNEPTSLRGTSRFLAQSTRINMTCDIYPRICRAKGSKGPDCCKKACVNVTTDRLNCGMCGMKCKYGEICCKEECVNPMSSKKHCGGCNNKCNKGDLCVYGMCSYA